MSRKELDNEIACRRSEGIEQLNMQAFCNRYAELGYTFDRSMDCTSLAQWMSGPRAGEHYPVRSLYPIQADNGISAWNTEARRDARFQAMQKLRGEIFAVQAGRIIEV